MLFFHRQSAKGSAAERLQRARARHPSAGGTSVMDAAPTGGLAFHEGDWSEISELLSNPDSDVRVAGRETSMPDLRRTLGELRSFVRNERVVGATHVRDWLLDLWSAAHDVDPVVAEPAESMLTRLVDRDLVNAGEVLEICDRTERVARDRGTATV